jgi:hypothetical protein
LLEVLLDEIHGQVFEPICVIGVDESIMENSAAFVDP